MMRKKIATWGLYLVMAASFWGWLTVLFMGAVMSGSREYMPSEMHDPKIAALVRQNQTIAVVVVYLFHWLPVVFLAAAVALWLLYRRG